MSQKKSKVLILGGASVHCKLVRAAQAKGLYVIVADYLAKEDSPAKQIADEAWRVDIYDIDILAQMAKKAAVKAILSTHLDPCQMPYSNLCRVLNLPCYGTPDAFFAMTNKEAFKQKCIENGVGVIPDYSMESIESGKAEFPLFVKPVDSRGSRGQTICNCIEDVKNATVVASSESSNGKYIIEKYMNDKQEVQITYFFVDGVPYLIRTVDSYKGLQPGMEKVVVCATSPSRYTGNYIETAEQDVLRMFRNIGIKNGPVFMQGFVDEGVFRFFDPGLRFPGVDYELIYSEVFKTDLLDRMWTFALNGTMPSDGLPEDAWRLKGKCAAVLFPCMTAGCIGNIHGEDSLKSIHEIVSYSFRHRSGDVVKWTKDVNQRYAEIDMVADSSDVLADRISQLNRDVFPCDCNGNNMQFDAFDPTRVNG